jgi:hypothetical protein
MSRNCGVLVEFGCKDSQRTSWLKDRIHFIPKFPVTSNRFLHVYTSRVIRIIIIVLIPHPSMHYAVGQSQIILTLNAACCIPLPLHPPCPHPLTLQTHVLNEHASTFGEVLVVVTLSEIHITDLPACRCNLFTHTVAHHHIPNRNICSMHSRILEQTR